MSNRRTPASFGQILDLRVEPIYSDTVRAIMGPEVER